MKFYKLQVEVKACLTSSQDVSISEMMVMTMRLLSGLFN